MIQTNPLPWAVIVSAYVEGGNIKYGGLLTHNETAHYRLGAQLRLLEGYKFKQVQGCYKGNAEHSYIVTLPRKATLPFIARLVFENFKQQSVLVLDPYRCAYLLFTDGREEKLGKWHSVPAIVAQSRDAWTYDAETDTYWVCD